MFIFYLSISEFLSAPSPSAFRRGTQRSTRTHVHKESSHLAAGPGGRANGGIKAEGHRKVDGVHDEVVAVVPTATTAERNVLHGALPAVPVQAIPHRRAGYTVARVVVQLECH